MKKETVSDIKKQLSTPKKSRALSPKTLQAKRLKTIDAKMKELDEKMKSCLASRGAIPIAYSEEYRKLEKSKKHIQEWELP
jgi:hypothetical protein